MQMIDTNTHPIKIIDVLDDALSGALLVTLNNCSVSLDPALKPVSLSAYENYHVDDCNDQGEDLSIYRNAPGSAEETLSEVSTMADKITSLGLSSLITAYFTQLDLEGRDNDYISTTASLSITSPKTLSMIRVKSVLRPEFEACAERITEHQDSYSGAIATEAAWRIYRNALRGYLQATDKDAFYITFPGEASAQSWIAANQPT